MIEKRKDPIPRLMNAVPIRKYPISLIPSKIEDVDVTMKKAVASQDLLIQWKSHILNPFTPLDGVEAEGCTYTNAFSSMKPRDDEPRIRDLFRLVLPLLYPSSAFPYNALFDFPQNRSLFPFQKDGVAFLLEQENALLADEMGLGKSIQAIVATRLLFSCGMVDRCLVVCPKSILTDWASKFNDWAPELTIFTISGTKARRRSLWTQKAHVYLVTYDTLREDVATGEEGVARLHFDLVILDEIQRIKNPSTQIFHAVTKIRGTIRWGLSGTPLENRVQELTTIFRYLKPGLFKSEIDDPMLVKIMVTPFLLRRTKSTVLTGLPEKIHDRVLLDLGPNQRSAYNQIEREGVIHLQKKGRRATVTHVLALISKLKQICNLEPVSGDSCKLEFVTDMLSNLLGTGDKMVIFSQYPTKTLEHIAPRLSGFNPLIYHGSLTHRQRAAVLKQFEEDERVKVMLISLKAGGLGLTLTAASYVTHFDAWWNPAVMDQAEDRTHRIGQTKPVIVTSLITKHTVEERIQRILEKKRTLFREVVGEVSDYKLTRLLTEQELFGLFGLQRPKKPI